MSDYRLRSYIFKCLEQRLPIFTKTPTGAYKSFELQIALCHKIGFGVVKNDEKNAECIRTERKSARRTRKDHGKNKNIKRKTAEGYNLFCSIPSGLA